jgi:antirestriction protein ArdC
VFVLAFSGFSRPDWMTYRQALTLGGQVRAGEQGLPVVLFKPCDETSAEDKEDTEVSKRSRFIIRYHTVFNRAQVDGLSDEPRASEILPMCFEDIPDCEAVAKRMPNPPSIRHGESRAWYAVEGDLVGMPTKEAFATSGDYYATLFHELTHATGHEDRLARPGIMECSEFGSPSYSQEELVAEMGAAYLCALTGISNQTIASSASYINGWITKLRSDRRIVVQAGAAAQRAVDYILHQGATDVTEAKEGEIGV